MLKVLFNIIIIMFLIVIFIAILTFFKTYYLSTIAKPL
jgi:hypothetical protein